MIQGVVLYINSWKETVTQGVYLISCWKTGDLKSYLIPCYLSSSELQLDHHMKNIKILPMLDLKESV
jgi:hypothetical protein